VTINDLAKLYDRLTPRERLPLIIAASERGDQAEADRLAHAAPRMELRLPDYHGLGEGLLWLTLFHMIGQLDLGLEFWQGLALAFGREAFPHGPVDQARAERLWDEQAARLLPLTGDEAAACLRRLGAGDAKVPTIEGSFQAMRAVIDQRVAWWNVDKG